MGMFSALLWGRNGPYSPLRLYMAHGKPFDMLHISPTSTCFFCVATYNGSPCIRMYLHEYSMQQVCWAIVKIARKQHLTPRNANRIFRQGRGIISGSIYHPIDIYASYSVL